MKNIYIVIPTYNEAENLPILIEEIRQYVPYAKFVVVDDSSPDGTAEVSRKMGADVIVRPRKAGVASAVRDGLAYVASKDPDGIAVVTDADGQHDPSIIPKMISLIEEEGYDIVIGSRFHTPRGFSNMPLHRRIISVVADLYTRLFISRARHLKDIHGNFFALRVAVIREAKLNPPNTAELLPEILAKGKWQKAANVGYVFRPRRAGKSKLKINHIVNYIIYILRISILKR